MSKKFVISSGHGDRVSGANGFMKEHDEAKKVVDRVYSILTNEYNGQGYKYHETSANTQNQNLANIVNYHNSKDREFDVAIHFNSAGPTASGSECCYYDQKAVAAKLSKAMADALGIADRGAKERKELYFLRLTNKPAVLLEVCFVTSQKDVDAYHKHFEDLCQAIASVLASHLDYAKHEVKAVSKEVKNDKYYTKRFDRLVTLTSVGIYKDLEFKHEVKRYPKDVKLDITGIAHASNGTPRFKTKEGYVTANRDYVKAYTISETYTVKKGDTLSKIAEKYHTTVKDIQTLNKIKDKNTISIGQKLKIK